MAKQELYLLKFSSGRMAQFRARAPQVMRRDAPEAEFGGILLYDVPNDRSVTPSPQHFPARQTQRNSFPVSRSAASTPRVYGHLNPIRHRNRPDMPAFTHQIDNRPVFLSLLKMLKVQISQFPSAQAAAKQDRENGAVPLAFECVGIGRLPEPTRLVCREPVSKPHAEFLHTLHATDAGREFRAKQAGICRLVR
jgi:hypothetical protein